MKTSLPFPNGIHPQRKVKCDKATILTPSEDDIRKIRDMLIEEVKKQNGTQDTKNTN